MGHIDTKAIVLRLLVLCITGTVTLPLFSKENGGGELDGISSKDLSNEEKNNWADKNNTWNVTTKHSTRESKNANETLRKNSDTLDFIKVVKLTLETKYYFRRSSSDEQQITVSDLIADSSLSYQTVIYEGELKDLSGGPKNQSNKKTKVKRSSSFDSLQETEQETNSGGEESDSRRTKKSFNDLPKLPSPRPWDWSWLFKESLPQQIKSSQETEKTENRDKRSDDEESTYQLNVTENLHKSMSSDAIEDSIDILESESDCYDQETNNTVFGGCDLDRTFEVVNFDNLTTQIHNAEVLLEEEIMQHNPGITTTEAVWNTDEFVDKTSQRK